MEINRRSFLIGAGSFAALGWTPLLTARAAPALDSRFMIIADMEIDHISEYETYGDSTNWRLRRNGNAPEISRDVSRSGSRSLKSYLNRLTSSSSYRTELESYTQARSMEWRRTYWIGFSLFVPADWRADSSSGEVLFQIHPRPDDWSNSKTPMMSVRTSPKSSNWRLRVMYLTVPEAQASNSDLVHAVDNRTQPIAIGRWTDFVIEYRPDWRPISDGGVGVTRIWLNAEKVIDYQGPNAYNETQGPYINFGCYKSQWRDRNFDDPVIERTYYHDEIRVSRPDEGSYNLVAPDPSGSVAAPAPLPPDVGVE